jgi:uncharacterized membrane protein
MELISRNIFKSNFLNWIKKNYIVILITAVVVSMTISLAIGLMQSVWFDEAYSIIISKQSFSRIISLTSVDVHPPFYYFILHIWGNIFGWSELALRSLSVLLMGGAAIIAGLLLKKLFGLRVALFAIPFTAFSSMLLRYGFEIRMYALASLIGIAATYILVLAVSSKNNKTALWFYILYAVLLAIGMYTLYYMALVWVAHLVWLVIISLKNKELVFRQKWIWAYVLGFIIYIPWIPVILKQLAGGALSVSSICDFVNISSVFGIVSFSFLYRSIEQLGAFNSIIVLFLIFEIIYLSIRVFQLADKKDKNNLILIACYVVVPVIVLAVASLYKPVYNERYLSHVLIGGSMFLGVASARVTKNSSWKAKLPVLLMVVILALGIGQLSKVGNYNFNRIQKPGLKQVASAMSDCGNGIVVLAGDPYVAIELNYYVKFCSVNFYAKDAAFGAGFAPMSNSNLRISDPKNDLASSKAIYYVYYDEAKLSMPDDFVLVDKQVYGGLTVDRFIPEHAK